MTNALRIGTRGSPLALWQAHHVRDLLLPLAESRPIELVEIQTTGDRIQNVALSAIGGDGLFTKEIQRALLDARVDLAVHSLKDLPTTSVTGLVLAAVPRRGPTGDVLVSRRWRSWDELPTGATVATSSLRRRAQVLNRRPDLRLLDVRGNVETRLRKLDEQGLDAILLAEAGLVRLGLQEQITEILDPSWMLPAVGQGALGLECRESDSATRELVGRLNHRETLAAVRAERSLLLALGGGCQVPIGAAGRVVEERLELHGVVLSPDGRVRIEAQRSAPIEHAELLGQQLAEQLLALGARQLLTSPQE